MTLKQVIAIGKAYRKLGDAIGEQLADIVADPSADNICQQNGNALRIADEQFLSALGRLCDDEELAEDIASLRMAVESAQAGDEEN